LQFDKRALDFSFERVLIKDPLKVRKRETVSSKVIEYDDRFAGVVIPPFASRRFPVSVAIVLSSIVRLACSWASDSENNGWRFCEEARGIDKSTHECGQVMVSEEHMGQISMLE